VEHLRERGLRNVGFVGLDIPANQPDQERQFFFPGGKSRAHSWEREQLRLMQWLRSLPRPLGVVAGDDEHGLHVLEACRRAVLPVPDEIAVIGIGNDVLTCELSIPSLTSVDLNAAGIGFEAAALLDGMLDGRQAARETRYIAPRGVIVRQSTDVQACEDEDVGRAMRFIQQKACQGLQVMDVLAHLGTSRASLQKRMKALLGRTIHQEIQRIRLTRARELLAAGDMTIKQVARESGFASVQYMTRVFRAATGETPAQYRSLRSR
jgi:LacI family transcriptional regulator